MGNGYIIGCNKCISDGDLYNIWKDITKIKGTFFNIISGGLMLCFCKEQIEKIYGINKKYNRDYRLLAAGDPPDEIYRNIGTITNDDNIDKVIFNNIAEGYEFTENLGHFPYYCKTCKKLFDHFYFEMVKHKEIYLPKYICKYCSNILEIAKFDWENNYKIMLNDKLGEEEYGEDKILFKYSIFNNNNKIIIKKGNIEEKLLCDNCGNNDFSILEEYFAD